jgi:hypothetical protein
LVFIYKKKQSITNLQISKLLLINVKVGNTVKMNSTTV